MTTATRLLAHLTTSPVPDAARTRAAAAVQAVTSAAATGASHPWLTALSDVAASLSTPPEAPVPGATARYAASWSAYLTAAASAHETPTNPEPVGDSAVGGGLDFAQVVVPAVLAVGAERGVRMGAVAEGVAVGLEVARRLDAVLGGGLGAFDRGAVIGRLGAVGGAGRVLGLSAEAMAHAYGVAGTQAAGFAATASGPVGALQIGKAAFDAVEAAYLALGGYTAGPTGIEGRRGFAALLAPSADLAGLETDPALPETPAAPGPVPVDPVLTVEDFIERSRP